MHAFEFLFKARNNVYIMSTIKYRFHVDPIKGIMRISKVTHEDYGNYTCRATNDANYSETKLLLNVLIRPRIYELINVTEAHNKAIEIICKATGRPAPKITFR